MDVNLMDSAPGIPCNDGMETFQYHTASDLVAGDYTIGLNEQLNSFVPQVVTTQPVQRAPGAIWTNGMMGLPDETYNVGYHMLPVDNQVSIALSHYEAPEVPVTQLPFKQALYNTTLVQEQYGQQLLYSALRAPGINEGY